MSKADMLRLPEYLGHILEAIERIYRYIEDLDEVAFLQSAGCRLSPQLGSPSH